MFQTADILESDTPYAMLRIVKQPVYQNKFACEKQIHSFGYCKIILQSEELLGPVSNIPRNPCSGVFLKKILDLIVLHALTIDTSKWWSWEGLLKAKLELPINCTLVGIFNDYIKKHYFPKPSCNLKTNF